MKYLTLLLLFLTINLSAQISEITKFPLQDTTSSITSSQLLESPNGNLIMFWSEGSDLFFGVSEDSGVSWKAKTLLADDILSREYDKRNYISAIVTDDNKILLAYTCYNIDDLKYYLMYLFSADNGLTWTSPKILNDSETLSLNFSLSKMINGEIWFLFSSECIKSIDNGITWSDPINLIDETLSSTSVQSLNDSTLILFYRKNTFGKILYRTSNDNGNSWNSENELLELDGVKDNFQTIRSTDGTIYIVYSDVFDEIYYLNNINRSTEWSEATKFTNFVGDDISLRVTTFGNKIVVSFASNRWKNEDDRSNEYDIWYGIIDESIDINTPPIIEFCRYSPAFPTSGDSILFTVYVYDEDSVQSVKLNLFYDGVQNYSIIMSDTLYDNNQNIYSTTINDIEYHNLITYSISVIDMQNYEIHSSEYPIAFESPNGASRYIVDVNNIKMPLLNNGNLGNVFFQEENVFSAMFDDNTIIFSSGFFLSGKSEGEVFSNGVFPSSHRIGEIYRSGSIGSNPADGRNVIYVVESSDPPFGQSWQAWENAVQNGANFYDGDNDGKYNPVDKNSNGIWDVNEDKPDLIGDITAWCVYNDGDDGNIITPFSMDMGIEIKQTLFASKALDIESLQNTIFVRYEIENKNPLVSKYDSVYFGVATDPDIGKEYGTDLVGADTLLNAGFAYKGKPDDSSGYGENPPSVMVQLLEGPHSFIPGETFIDNNSNQIFDNGDVAIDSAKQRLGPDRGMITIPGAKNLSMTNFYHFFRYGGGHNSPDNITEMRNELLPGINQNGNSINVCELKFGNGADLNNCGEVDNHFMYSGNPVDGSGWLCTRYADTRMLISSGPFELRRGEAITLVYAFVVGRGNDRLNSVSVVKNYASEVAKVFEENLINLPVGVNDKPQKQIPTEYSLSQNYPNPFNPSTTIKYSIPQNVSRETSVVSVVVYDILGREVSTLVKRQQKAGNYEVQFDASNLTSGVYFYQLHSGNFVESKKMILLR